MRLIKHFFCGLLISLCFYSWGVFTTEGINQFSDKAKAYESNDISKFKSINSAFQFPLAGVPIYVTSPFGKRIHPLTGNESFHAGVDLGAETGTPVLAALSGEVIFTGWQDGYGNTIIIQHNDNFRTLYAHLSEISVNQNQSLAQSSVIGKVGATGNVTGPHLHFEVRKQINGNWQAINPDSEIGDIKIAKISPIPTEEFIPDCNNALWGDCQPKPSCDNALFGECKP